MSIALLERITTALAALAVLAVTVLVATLSLLPGTIRPGVSREVVESSLETLAWLDARRQQARADGARPERPPLRPAQAGPGPRAEAERRPSGTTRAAGPRDAGAPPATWIPRVAGATYAPTRRVPAVVRLRYQSFEAAWDLAQEGSGRFVTTDRGEPAYELTALDPTSLLATQVDLRPGDRVVSVNGAPLGTSVAAGRALFEQLAGERRFVLVVERRGQPVVLSFEVDE